MDVSRELPRTINVRLLDPVVDFLVFGTCFFLSCLLFPGELDNGLLVQILIYATILLSSVSLLKGLCSAIGGSFTDIQKQILGNASGILIGTCIILFFAKYIAGSIELAVAMVFSSVMAFFVLGTISSLIGKKSASQSASLC